MKRILTIALAVMMMLTLCIPVFAETEGQGALASNDGKITIENAAVGETYAVYQMAVLESYSGTSYSYWVDETWRSFFQTEAAKKYFSVSADGYLTTTGNVMQDANKERMVKDALAYIETNNIQPKDTVVAETGTVIFENLNLGYYLVDSSLGTLCNLDTTDKEIIIRDKNAGPSITKEVQDDSGTAYGKTNDADLFQDIQFRMIVDCKKGAVNYVIHDTMTNMTFNDESLKIYNGAPLDDESNLVDAANYTLSENVACGNATCTFHIAFNQAFCDTMTDATDLYVYYTAALTADAVIDGAGNPNEVYLSYGNAQTSTHDTTTTYTYQFQLVKTDNAGVYLAGATFTLWDASENGNKIALVKTGDRAYRVANTDDPAEEIVYLIDMTDSGKFVTVSGLDGRTDYYLQEEAAPAGYNRLSARQKFTISNSSLNGTPLNDPELYENGEGGVRIINKTGAILPETGGFGTTMFIIIGSILVLGAGVLLATKLRMSKIAG